MLRALISRPIGSTQLAVSCWSAIDNSINAPIQFSRVTNHSISQLGQLQHRNWCFYYLIQKLLLLYIFWRQHERPLVGRWRNSEQTSPIKAQPRAALLLIDLFSLAYLLSRALDRSNLESSLSLSLSLAWLRWKILILIEQDWRMLRNQSAYICVRDFQLLSYSLKHQPGGNFTNKPDLKSRPGQQRGRRQYTREIDFRFIIFSLCLN